MHGRETLQKPSVTEKKAADYMKRKGVGNYQKKGERKRRGKKERDKKKEIGNRR